MKKVVLILMLLLTVALLLPGCGGESYKTVPTEELCDAMIEALGEAADYMSAEEAHYEIYFGEHEAYGKLADAHMVFSRAETDVNEFGVFRAKTVEDAAAIRAMLEVYLEENVAMLRSFAANYSPADMGKIDNAAVEVMGNYVFYYILSPEDESAIKQVLNTLLTEE